MSNSRRSFFAKAIALITGAVVGNESLACAPTVRYFELGYSSKLMEVPVSISVSDGSMQYTRVTWETHEPKLTIHYSDGHRAMFFGDEVLTGMQILESQWKAFER